MLPLASSASRRVIISMPYGIGYYFLVAQCLSYRLMANMSIAAHASVAIQEFIGYSGLDLLSYNS